jgi:tetratricopeptide (TPR) repeat protein
LYPLFFLLLVVQAIKYHKQELTISKEVNDRSSEASTHGNLAVAYQALGAHEMALLHYRAHLNTARELKDAAGEACALLNLGNCLSSRGEFGQAVPFYENYLMLSQVPSGSHICFI